MSRPLRAGLSGILAALVVAGAPSPARATTVVQLDEAQLVDRADLVVHGTVLGSRSVARSGPGIGVVTEVDLEVHEVLKGAHPNAVLTLTLPGGARGARVVRVAGVPAFHPGEQVCVFLVRLPRGDYTTLGVSQGKYGLTPDPATGLTVARQAQGVRALPVPGVAAHALRAAAPEVDDWAALRQRIRRRAGERR